MDGAIGVTPRLSRRGALALVGAGAAAAATMACAPVASGPGTSGSPTLAPKAGGVLKVGMASDLAVLNAQRITPTVLDTIMSVTDTLMRYDNKLVPQAQLAETWDVSSDLRQIKVNLRKGVQFHTGRELTSDDIKWNALWVRDPKVQATQLAAMSPWWTTIETPDKSTVIFKSESPRSAMFDFFDVFNIIDPVTAQAPGGNTKIVGTGPFTFKEWVTGDHVSMPKFAGYWRSGRPYLDEVYIQVTKDIQATIIQLEAGALDAVLAVPPREVGRLGKDPKYGVFINAAGGQWFTTIVNTTFGPLKDKRVRQAINYLLDRQRFVDTVLVGTSQSRALPWAPHAPAYDAAKNASVKPDAERAKALLAQAGLSGPVELELGFVNTDAEVAQFAQVLQADAKKANVNFAIKQYETATYSNILNTQKYPGVFLRYSGYGSLESSSLFTLSTYMRPADNASGFRSDKYAQLVEASGKEPDKAKRKGLYDQLNEMILDEAWVHPLAGYDLAIVAKANVKGIGRSVRDSTDWVDAWIG